MSQQCVTLTNKNNIAKLLNWDVFTDEKADRQAFLTGLHTSHTSGRWN